MTRVSAICLAGLLSFGAEGDLAGADTICEALMEGYDTLRSTLERLLAPLAR